MNKFLSFILIAFFSINICSQTFEENLPCGFSEGEKAYIMENYGVRGDSWQNAWEKYLLERSQLATRDRKPSNIIYAPSEFANSDGVCFSWRGYETLLKQLIKEVSLDSKAYVAVSSNVSSVRDQLKNYGCNMQNVEFIETYLNTVWMRDYGPWFVYTQQGPREVIDLSYNRPRPQDDKFPSTLANKYGFPSHLCSLVLPGGNLIIDGHGVAIMTDVVFDSSQGGVPSMSEAQLRTYMKDYFNCHKVIITKDMQNDGTGHIDMFCKLLDDRNIIVGKYNSPSDGYGNNYYILNEVAELLANETNGKGEKFIITRIPMPKYNYGTTATHTNSLIVNKKVLVPIYNKGTDQEALNIYKSLLPGYKVVGFDCNQIISANGAIHCITKMVMSEPVSITQISAENLDRGMSKIDVKLDYPNNLSKYQVSLFWSKSKEGPFNEKTMDSFDKKLYSTILSLSENEIYYYIAVKVNDKIIKTLPKEAPKKLYTLK